jgi:TatD DNase family protein
VTYTDTHTHLDHCQDDAAALVRAAAEARVTCMIQSGTDAASSRLAVELAERFPALWATVGFHPHDAKALDEAGMAAIEQLTHHPRVVGVGEAGLDYYRDHSPRSVQLEVFGRHVDLARAADLPLVVHTREADDHTLALLDEQARGLTVVLHCFSMPDRLSEVVSRGYYVSFAGNVTYKNAEALREAARTVPDELLLVETDAPYLTPVPFRGRPNTPAMVVSTYAALAEVRGVPPEELASLVRTNAGRAFPRLNRPRAAGEASGSDKAGRVGIFYGSTSYGTAWAAGLIHQAFGPEVADIRDIKESAAADLRGYGCLVFGTSTWGVGGLQHDWDGFMRELDRVDLTGVKAAVFALGDQVTWSTTFVNSMGIVYDKLLERGATMVGAWPTEGYAFERSGGVRDGRFVGLALDKMNQKPLTGERVRAWVEQLRREFEI